MAVNKGKPMQLEDYIAVAGFDLRSLSWHTDGRIIAKTGKEATIPKKLYSGKTPQGALEKLIKDREKLWESKSESS